MLNNTGFQNKVHAIYKEFITDMAEHAVGLTNMHYQAIPNIRQNWQTIIPYMPHIEESIINHARLFIRINVGLRNKMLGRELLPLMAEYIAEYTTRANKNLVNGATIVEDKINVYNTDLSHDAKQKAQAKIKKERAINTRHNEKQINEMFARYSGRLRQM